MSEEQEQPYDRAAGMRRVLTAAHVAVQALIVRSEDGENKYADLSASEIRSVAALLFLSTMRSPVELRDELWRFVDGTRKQYNPEMVAELHKQFGLETGEGSAEPVAAANVDANGSPVAEQADFNGLPEQKDAPQPQQAEGEEYLW